MIEGIAAFLLIGFFFICFAMNPIMTILGCVLIFIAFYFLPAVVVFVILGAILAGLAAKVVIF